MSGIHELLKRRIIMGAYSAGEPLSQLSVAQELGISRTPLREVFRLLEQEGLILSEHNKRFRVADSSPEDLEELYSLRITHEAAAARISVPHLGSHDLARLTDLLAEMDSAADEEAYDRWHDPHSAFHRHLLVHSGRRHLEIAQQLSDHAERYRYASTLPSNPASWSAGRRDHHALLEAAAIGDGEEVARTLAAHYGRVALSVLSISAPLHDPRTLRLTLNHDGLPVPS
ncbi:GntR family transcriptional regulator [Microbacterium jepli]|uniref:GntR family transcriptional regulator n=1 Tax=Microbacterium sp. 1P10UE TaxID=3132288 RepID=UPI0039A035CE